MIFYFSGTTSGADPERFEPEPGVQADVMMSFFIAADGKYDKEAYEGKTLPPDKRFAEVYLSRTNPELCKPVRIKVNNGDAGYRQRKATKRERAIAMARAASRLEVRRKELLKTLAMVSPGLGTYRGEAWFYFERGMVYANNERSAARIKCPFPLSEVAFDGKEFIRRLDAFKDEEVVLKRNKFRDRLLIQGDSQKGILPVEQMKGLPSSHWIRELPNDFQTISPKLVKTFRQAATTGVKPACDHATLITPHGILYMNRSMICRFPFDTGVNRNLAFDPRIVEQIPAAAVNLFTQMAIEYDDDDECGREDSYPTGLLHLKAPKLGYVLTLRFNHLAGNGKVELADREWNKKPRRSRPIKFPLGFDLKKGLRLAARCHFDELRNDADLASRRTRVKVGVKDGELYIQGYNSSAYRESHPLPVGLVGNGDSFDNFEIQEGLLKFLLEYLKQVGNEATCTIERYGKGLDDLRLRMESSELQCLMQLTSTNRRTD